MKTCMRLVCITFSLLGAIICGGQTAGQQIGEGFFQNGGIQPGMADVNVGWPGRVWVEANLAEDGLGYTGSYGTLGAKTRLFSDFLDGRWLFEAQGHVNPESEGWFANVGIERVFSLKAAGAEVSTGFWFDYDNDLQGDFAHSFTALGINGSIETNRWALHGNGYFPIGDDNFNIGDPLNGNCFVNNVIVTQAAIDSALKGFDTLFEFKPMALGHVNGTIGIGGYGYQSDLVEFFGGVRGRVGMQFDGGVIVSAEINHDNRFDLTGVLQLGWLFGTGARGTEYGLLGNDLEPTLRNDHIVRFQQELQLAIDPDTGRAYNVYHVDNLASAGGDGSFERPFDTLKGAETASYADDIIFVREGGGSTRNMDEGIVLKDGQLLLGDGVQQLIPLADGTNFILCNDIDGNTPRISNDGGFDAVTLANRNTVRGFTIDGSGVLMRDGISGIGVRDGLIEDITTVGSPILNGVYLKDVEGDWTFRDNNLQTALQDGIFIEDACDPDSVFFFETNIASNNGRDGIHMDNFDAESITFVNNTTDNNGRDGIRLENFKPTPGNRLALDFINPVANANDVAGIHIENIAGNVRFINSTITNNLMNGIVIRNVTNPLATDQVFVGTSGGGTSLFDGNGVGTGSAILNVLGVVGEERLNITDTLIQNGGSGITSTATVPVSFLTTNIIDNNGILNNITGDGIALNAQDGGSHIATVRNTGAPLQIIGNGGNGIAMNVGNGLGGGPATLVDATIENVLIDTTAQNGIFSAVDSNGQNVVRANNVTINNTLGDGIQITADNDMSAAINTYEFNNFTITETLGTGARVRAGTDTFLDFRLVNSVLDNLTAGSIIGGNGVSIFGTGNTGSIAVDTRVRAFVSGNTIIGFNDGNGIQVTGAGDAHVFADLVSNDLNNNGLGIDGVGGQITLPFFDGIDVLAIGDSQVFANIGNNNITANGEQGVDLTTGGTGTITALVANNFIGSNDTQDDQTTIPDESNNFDMTAFNGPAGTICLGMSNNFFNLPVLVSNANGPANFSVELDGLTNGLGVPIFAGGVAGFTRPPFGGCAADIATERQLFVDAGFLQRPTP